MQNASFFLLSFYRATSLGLVRDISGKEIVMLLAIPWSYTDRVFEVPSLQVAIRAGPDYMKEVPPECISGRGGMFTIKFVVTEDDVWHWKPEFVVLLEYVAIYKVDEPASTA